MKEGLNLLIDNIQNTKNKLYNNLVNKGVQTITTSSTLSEMADSVNLITTGESTTTTITKIVNTNWLVSPEELIYDYENQYSEKHNWSNDTDFNNNQRRQLIYPTGDYVFNNDWEVMFYNGGSLVAASHTNGDTYTTRCTYVTDEFFRLKNDSRYELITDCWNEWTQEQNYYKATEIPLNNIEEIYIKPENKDNIYVVTAATQCEFKFYEYNPYAYSYEEHQFIHPSNGSEYTFYPIIEKKPYYLKLVYDGSNSYEVVGAIIEFTHWYDYQATILPLPSFNKRLTADYLLFKSFDGWYDKFNFEFGAGSNGYDYAFDYHSKNITRLETVTFNDRCVHIWYGFEGSYIDYIGELIFSNNIKETYYDWMGDIEYCLMKNIGACPDASLFRFTSSYWGIGEKYSNSRQSLVDSLITYSYDRASAGYSTVNIQLNQNIKARLTESEIAQITAKGFTIA